MPDVSASRPRGAPDRLPSRRDRHGPTRALASLAASLAVVNAVLLLWPDPDLSADVVRQPPPRELVVMQMVEPTTQPPPPANLPPPPPPPADPDLPPEEVPDEVIIRDLELDLPAPPAPEAPRRTAPPRPGPPAPPAPPPPAPSSPAPASDRIVERPERSPRPLNQPLPVYPRGSSERGLRAKAVVRVLVSQGGQPTDAVIVERLVLDGDRERPVASFPAEFEASFLEAARRALFRPARDDGERVRAYALLTLSLDPPR